MKIILVCLSKQNGQNANETHADIDRNWIYVENNQLNFSRKYYEEKTVQAEPNFRK